MVKYKIPRLSNIIFLLFLFYENTFKGNGVEKAEHNRDDNDDDDDDDDTNIRELYYLQER